jgi:hypothetical protein
MMSAPSRNELDHAIRRSTERSSSGRRRRTSRGRVEDAHERSTPLSTGLLDSERDGSHRFALASEVASGKHEVADSRGFIALGWRGAGSLFVRG